MNSSRRLLFWSAAAFLIASVLSRFARAKSSHAEAKAAAKALLSKKRRRVIVIGAGISGLYAAHLCRKKNFDVTVLEASGRTGGKTMATTLDGAVFDLGGQAFNKDMKRVIALGKHVGLKPVKRPEQGSFYVEGSKLIVGKDYDKYEAATQLINKKCEEFYPQLDQPESRARLGPRNVLDWAKEFLAADVVPQFISYFESEWCHSPQDVSLSHYLEVQRAFPSDESDEMSTRFDLGMAGLSDGLTKELGDRVKTGMPVEKIEMTADEVRVTAKGETFNADDVIVAMPMPQLAKVQLVGEGLQAVHDAAASFKGGSVRKVLAHFEKPFWGDRPRDGVFSDPSGLTVMDNSDHKGKFYTFALFVGGPSAHKPISQETLFERLAIVLGDSTHKPIDSIEREWFDTDYLPGGYCSNRPPSANAHFPVPTSVGRVFLAGSETADVFPSYVEGALEAAERAVKNLSKRA